MHELITRKVRPGIALAALSALALAGCAGSAASYRSTGSVSYSKNCRTMNAEMSRLASEGKGDSQRYRQLLDRYFRSGCFR